MTGGPGVGLADRSAHVAPAGYLPYAPYSDGSAERTLMLFWLDSAQLTRMNETEANCHCATLASAERPLVLETGTTVDRYRLYRSRHGLLAATGDDVPVAATTQRRILAELRTRPGFAVAPAEDLTTGPPAGA